MTTLFITAGDMRWASARIRAYWPARYMDAKVVTFEALRGRDVDFGEFSAVVWQKSADIEVMRELRKHSIQQFIDMCDPIYWFNPSETKQMLELVDGVVCSTDKLAADLKHVTGYEAVTVIPDRMEMEQYPIQKRHIDSDPVRFIWYGLWANRSGLFGAFPALERLACNGHRIELTVYDDRPDIPAATTDKYPVYHSRWELKKENAVIAAHDIALLPPYPGAWGKLKSNNRTLTAWACGLPAHDGIDYDSLETLVSAYEARQINANIGYRAVINTFQVFQSAADWERILGDV